LFKSFHLDTSPHAEWVLTTTARRPDGRTDDPKTLYFPPSTVSGGTKRTEVLKIAARRRTSYCYNAPCKRNAIGECRFCERKKDDLRIRPWTISRSSEEQKKNESWVGRWRIVQWCFVRWHSWNVQARFIGSFAFAVCPVGSLPPRLTTDELRGVGKTCHVTDTSRDRPMTERAASDVTISRPPWNSATPTWSCGN